MERRARWSLVVAGCVYAAAVGGLAQSATGVPPGAPAEARQRPDASVPPRAVDDAVRRSLVLLQASARTWSERRPECASCHHQSLGTLTVEVARERGYAVDAEGAEAQAIFTARTRDEAVSLDTYIRGQGPVGGGSMGLAYALTGLTSVRWPASRVTDVLAHFVARRQLPDGRFPSPDHRPPHEDSQVAATAVAIRALLAYGRDRAEVGDRVRKAAAWLETAGAETTEDRTMQLLGLRWAGRDALAGKLQAALLDTQREDGGWSQLPTRPSDAYATGQVLVALNQAGIAAQSAAYRRGVAFLMASQEADGSWRVQTRRKNEVTPGQEYFESGFPHGRDQFISYAGSAWATMALCLTRSSGASKALTDTTARARRSPEDETGWTEGTTPLMKAALFGPPEGLKVLLDAGAGVDTANAEGTTALMWAATRGPLPVQWLIERGADAKVADVRGFTPLMIAAGGGQLDVMRALIAAGADVNALSANGWSALRDAVRSGNVDAVRLLLDSGAKLLISPRNTNRMMMIAIIQEDTAMLELLLDRGLDLNHSFGGGYTGLMAAAEHGLEGPLRIYLRRKADLNHAEARGGLTALMFAALQDPGHDRFVRALVDAGARLDTRSTEGLTAADYARKYGHSHLLAALGSAQVAPGD